MLALSALLVAPDEALPPEVVGGMGQVTAGCLVLLSDLKKQQARPFFLSSKTPNSGSSLS